MPPRALSPESSAPSCSSCTAKSFTIRGFADGGVTIAKQMPYKPFVFTSFADPGASTHVFSATSAYFQKNRGAGGALSKIAKSHCEASHANEHSTPGQSATITFTSRALWRVVGDRSRLAQHRLLAAGHRSRVSGHRSLSCATLPSQRKRLCDPHVPASRSSSSSFSSAHRMGMRVRWWLSGPVGPAESNPQLPNGKEGR